LVLNLLLFISALLTGLTGAISGAQRADAPAVHQSIALAIEATAEKAAERASPQPVNVGTIRRPIHSTDTAKTGWALKFQDPAIEIGRIYERLLV
jgi:hypothetical protein